ncbi:hypothetical protein ACMFMG_003361 [Clarireedia jacksonii]
MATSVQQLPQTSTSGLGLMVEGYNNLHHDSLTVPLRKHSDSSTTGSTDHVAMKGKKRASSQRRTRPKASSSASRNTHSTERTQSTSSTQAENRAAQRAVRSLPPWIASHEDGDDLIPVNALSTPSRIQSAQHNSSPAQSARRISHDGYVDPYDDVQNTIADKKVETGFFGGLREPVRGRKWDHARDDDPVIMKSGINPNASPWRNFIKASAYGSSETEDYKLVDQQFLDNLTPGYDRPWRGDLEKNGDQDPVSALLYSKKRRRTLIRRIQQTLLMNPYVPLIFRLIVLVTSVIALGIAASVHHLSNSYSYAQNPSTTMAIVVDVVAIPYTLYLTWDEYTGKPLGLRSPKAKIRLVLCDLFFIIFEASNLTLAFDALSDDTGSCKRGNNGYNGIICHRQRTLCAIIIIALFAWGLTFSVSIFRLVERVGGREEAE